eukprot:2516502-Prymnesium_polylepis.1
MRTATKGGIATKGPHGALSALAAVLLFCDLAVRLIYQAPSLPVYGRPCAGSRPAASDGIVVAARQAAGGDKTLILSFVRSEQAELASNFIATAAAAGLKERLLLVALDDASEAL